MFKCVAILIAVLGATCEAFPGGYTAKGGVYTPQKSLSYMHDAIHAGKMAWEQKFETEAEIGAFEEERGARQASYTPTFYTSAQGNHGLAPIVQAQPVSFETSYGPSYARQARDTFYEQPLYYYSSSS